MSLDQSVLRQNDIRQNNVLNKTTSLDKSTLDKMMLDEPALYHLSWSNFNLPRGHSKSESCASVTPSSSRNATVNSILGFIWKNEHKKTLATKVDKDFFIWGMYLLGPKRAQARARSAGSGFYYITQKPKPALAWFLG
jgi:hypothetical protein